MNKDLTAGKPEKVLWQFCLPLFGSILFQQLYNIADSFVAGKFISDNALAAVGNSYEITLIFIAFAFGCNIACSVIAALFFGAKQYEDLKTMENQLKALRKDGGEEYRLLKLPSPEAIYDDGERLPATYANFLIINGAVVYPTYRQPKNDAEAERILKMAFPEHEMIAVDACAAIRQHGSIHCLTMQYPKGKVKK